MNKFLIVKEVCKNPYHEIFITFHKCAKEIITIATVAGVMRTTSKSPSKIFNYYQIFKIILFILGLRHLNMSLSGRNSISRKVIKMTLQSVLKSRTGAFANLRLVNMIRSLNWHQTRFLY